jgi:hypothetical protein
MKKIFTMMFAAVSLAACNDGTTDNATVNSEDTTTSTETSTTMNRGGMTSDVDTSTTATTSTTTTSTTYTPEDGAVTYRNNKLQVRRRGQWVNADEDVKMDNDVVVYRTGRVRQGEREVELREGEVVNRTGRFFDKTGQAIERLGRHQKRCEKSR